MNRLQLPSLTGIKWMSAFQPQRSDPDLRPLPLGFMGIILVGALALFLPWCHNPGKALHWLDALFLSTSAVCVTGLSTVNVAEIFNFPGQVVLLGLIQLGGVGIVTASLALVMLAGDRLSLANEEAVAATVGRLQRASPAELFRYSCLLVMLCEAAGACALYTRLQHTLPEADPLALLWQAGFHSVSAFCNAGLSIFPEGLVQWRSDFVLLGIIDLLVIAGGIGLLSLINLRYWYFWRRDPRRRGRFTLQTRLAVAMTLILLVGGTLVTLLFEYNHTLHGMAAGEMLSSAFFHSTMLRTAGYNVVDIGQMHPATMLASIALMFVGGAPGSMAGGIKTVTFAIILLAARAALLRQDSVQVFGRTVSPRIITQATMVLILGLATAGVGASALMLTEFQGPAASAPGGWLGIIFEAVSALGTVGLSTGTTPLLSSAGKCVVIVLMFVGRVGPLMLSVYLSRPVHPWRIRHPKEDVSLG